MNKWRSSGRNVLGGADTDFPSYIAQTEDEGFVVFGTTFSNDGDVSGNPSWPGINAAIWVVKLDSQGSIEWQSVWWLGLELLKSNIQSSRKQL